MKITEIETVHTSGVNLTSITRTNEIQFGFNNEIAGYAMKKNIINGVNAYYLLNNELIIAGVICKEVSINGVKYLQTLGVTVAPLYRGKNLGILMYHAIKHNEHMNLISDTKQTAAGKKLWAELAKTFTVKVIELSSGEILSDNAEIAYLGDTDTTALVTETLLVGNSLLIPTMKISADSII